MKITVQTWITAAAVIIAFSCASWAWTAAQREKKTNHENQALHSLLSELQELDETTLFETGFDSESSQTADDLSVIQELMEEPEVVSEDAPKETYI